ncbi:protein spindle-F isoform X1 [Neodiprion pinetum]|uniref:protein spindle-F isoform X1 n=1 Tax=Neodiprion pinetum TaxID=441929 RepID=UPI001EDD3476|nr:protein spindle-F isoform X1 [Neodiprion pinetum]
MSEISDENFGSQYALQVALQTMKERCQQFQKRLDIAERENASLRVKCYRESSTAMLPATGDNQITELQILTDKVEQLTRIKTQLTHHIFMVANENRQLWKRLSRLTKTNKNLGNHLNKISDALQQHPSTQPLEALSYNMRLDFNLSKNESDQFLVPADLGKIVSQSNETSLEEISLKLINSIKMEKSELEQQYAEMVEMQNTSEINLQNMDYFYPESMNSDCMEQLKQHDTRLSHTKHILLSQQTKLKTIMGKLKTIKKGAMCKSCRDNARKKMCQAGTQFNSDDSLKENGATQTSLIPNSTTLPENMNYTTDGCSEVENKICPMCEMIYGKTINCAEFHEHVLSHFSDEEKSPGCDFEII